MGLAIPRYTLPKIDLAGISRKQLDPCLENLKKFIGRYEPRFYRVEQARNAEIYLEGLLSDLPRKTCEPIAIDHGRHRKPLQNFVGAGRWDDEQLLEELHAHVRQEIGDPQGVLVLDTTSFLKKGHGSVGVKIQWSGRLQAKANCQVGLFLAYAARGSATLVDRRLFLPREWCRRSRRRLKAQVPDEIGFATRHDLALELLRKDRERLPHAWVVGDTEFGHIPWFRKSLDRMGERYLLEVPFNTLVRDVEGTPPGKRFHHGGTPMVPFRQVASWARNQPASRWTRVGVRATDKGPLEVEAIRTVALTRDDCRNSRTEVLLVIREIGPDPHTWYFLSNGATASLVDLVRAAKERQRIEECFERAKGEAGLAQYEVRSWAGWHHHTMLSMLATWFLTLEARRLGGKNPGSLSAVGGDGVSHAVA
jgi:SRSO17 transposase